MVLLVISMFLSSLARLKAIGKALSRTPTFSNTGSSHYTGKQVSVVPLLTCSAFLTLEPVTHWKGLNNMFLCRESGFDDFIKRIYFLAQSLMLCEIRHIISFLLLTSTLHKAVKLIPSVESYFKVFELDVLLTAAFFFLSHINDEQLWICPHLDATIISNTLKFFKSLYCSEKLQVEGRLPFGCFSVSQLWNISVATSTIAFMEQEIQSVYF